MKGNPNAVISISKNTLLLGAIICLFIAIVLGNLSVEYEEGRAVIRPADGNADCADHAIWHEKWGRELARIEGTQSALATRIVALENRLAVRTLQATQRSLNIAGEDESK